VKVARMGKGSWLRRERPGVICIPGSEEGGRGDSRHFSTLQKDLVIAHLRSQNHSDVP
jgi:hypothetical protein